MKNTISNFGVIDSRDIINRIEELIAERDALAELIAERDALAEAVEEFFVEDTPESEAEAIKLQAALDEWNASDEAEELKELLNVQDQAEPYAPDWKYGTTLIHDNYFEEYTNKMLADRGILPDNLPSYLSVIVDYDAIRQDYTGVDFDGVTYLIR